MNDAERADIDNQELLGIRKNVLADELRHSSCTSPTPGSIPSSLFPFDYVGGGYFRKKGVERGKNAEILHGMQAVEYLYSAMESNEKSSVSRGTSVN